STSARSSRCCSSRPRSFPAVSRRHWPRSSRWSLLCSPSWCSPNPRRGAASCGVWPGWPASLWWSWDRGRLSACSAAWPVCWARAGPPSWGRCLWGVAGVAGGALGVLGPGAGLSLRGVVAGVLGASATALGIVLTKHWGQPVGVGPMGFAGWQLTAGGLVMLLLTAAFEGAPARIDAPAIGGYLWLGLLGGLLAYSLWFRGIARLPVTATALLVLLSPLTAAVLGMVVLGERFTPVQALGFALALIALTAGQLPGRPTARASTLKPMPDRSTPTAQEVTS